MSACKNYDRIFIEGLALDISIGIHAHEKTTPQRVLIDVDLYVAPAQSGGSDDIRNTVSYETCVQRITALAGSKHFNLVETLAEEIAEACLEHEAVQKTRVKVRKPDIITNTKGVGIKILRPL